MTHFMLKEAVLQGFISWVAPGAFEQQLVFLRMGKDHKNRILRCELFTVIRL